jgi:molecular chaperone GrpE
MSDEQGTAVESPDGEEPTESGGTADESAAEPPIEGIADRIDGTEPEAVAEEIATLREEAAALRRERDDLESRLKRKQAEFQNYKKRQKKRREKERARATEELVEDLLEVRDNLSRALEQDEDADIREGVEATFRGLDDVLDGQGVEPIEPEPGTETDPKRHEVLLRVESDEPAGTVADLHRPGYEMAGKVLRTAQVTVSEGSTEGAESDDDGDSDDEGTEPSGDEHQDE